MAQPHPHHEHETPDEIDEAWIEQLRRDPEVTVVRRTTTEPFVPTLRVSEPVDILWLLGRGCTDEEERHHELRHRP